MAAGNEGPFGPSQQPASDSAAALATCRALLAAGNLAPALTLAADVLALDPNDRAALDVVDDIVLAAPDALALAPHEPDERTWPAVAVRARIHMMRKEFPAALELLAAVVRLRPTAHYLDWPRRWLQPHVVATLPLALLMRTVVDVALHVAGVSPTPLPPEDPHVANLRSAIEYLAAIRQVYAQEWSVWRVEATLRRRVGDLDGALATARAAERLSPTPIPQLELAECLLCLGQREEAAHHLVAAASTTLPDDATAFRVCSLLLDVRRPAEAVPHLEGMLARMPGHVAAKASLHFARVLLSGSEPDRVALLQLRERTTHGTRIGELANQLDPPIPGWNVLSGPGDCTAAALRALVRQLVGLPHGSTFAARLAVTYLEAPSVHVAFKLVTRVTGRAGTLEIAPEQPLVPDPRVPRAPVDFQLFRYDGDTPVPVYPAADPNLQRVVAQVAAELFQRDRWDAVARPLAGNMGPAALHGLLAVMTDPPAPEGGFGPIQWVQRVQIGAAVLISHLDGGWLESVRRRALFSLALGPSDWTVGAALIALAWRAADEPAIRADVEPLFEWLSQQIPREGYTSWEATLAQVWLALGRHPVARERQLTEWAERALSTAATRNRARLLGTGEARTGSVRPGPPAGHTMV